MNEMATLRSLQQLYHKPVKDLTVSEKALVLNSIYYAWIKADILDTGDSKFLRKVLEGETKPVKLNPTRKSDQDFVNKVFDEMIRNQAPNMSTYECIELNVHAKYVKYSSDILTTHFQDIHNNNENL
jgi:hypothetical protein